MFNREIIKKIFVKGGEIEMRLLSLIVVGAVILLIPAMAQADVSLGVSASITAGTSLGDHILLRCKGYSYDDTGDPFAQCTDLGTSTSMDFGDLITRLKNPDGSDAGGSDCFYAEDFYIVYLFPDAFGGAGYDVRQSAAAIPLTIGNALIRTPVYSQDDEFCWGSPRTCAAQGPLTGTELSWNPQITDPGTAVLAKNSGLILKADRARIIRAEYGIPPIKGDGTPWATGWQKIPLDATADDYSANVTITLTEW